MSTRCNVIVKDEYHEILFYRHSDGYPSGVAPTLGDFLHLVKTNKLRDNAEQSAGWLIVLGYEEYLQYNSIVSMRANSKGTDMGGWKVGAYEPAGSIHGDIEYLYEIDLSAMTLRGWKHDGDEKGDEITAELTEEVEKALRP